MQLKGGSVVYFQLVRTYSPNTPPHPTPTPILSASRRNRLRNVSFLVCGGSSSDVCMSHVTHDRRVFRVLHFSLFSKLCIFVKCVNFVTWTLSCVHVIQVDSWPGFYYSHFVVIHLDGLHNIDFVKIAIFYFWKFCFRLWFLFRLASRMIVSYLKVCQFTLILSPITPMSWEDVIYYFYFVNFEYLAIFSNCKF